MLLVTPHLKTSLFCVAPKVTLSPQFMVAIIERKINNNFLRLKNKFCQNNMLVNEEKEAVNLCVVAYDLLWHFQYTSSTVSR